MSVNPLVVSWESQRIFTKRPFDFMSMFTNPMFLMSAVTLLLFMVMPRMQKQIELDLKNSKGDGADPQIGHDTKLVDTVQTKQVELPDFSGGLAKWFVPFEVPKKE